MGSRIELRGAAALVTGAGSGIGRATALALARAGAKVLAVDRDEVTVETTVVSCLDRGVEAAAYVCDVADRAAMGALAERVEREHGALDRNSVGSGKSGSVRVGSG